MISPYRCETCKNVECECHERNDHKDGFVFGIVSINRFTAEKGCASHSSYKSERDLALDELYNSLKYGGIHMLVERLNDFHKGDKS